MCTSCDTPGTSYALYNGSISANEPDLQLYFRNQEVTHEPTDYGWLEAIRAGHAAPDCCQSINKNDYIGIQVVNIQGIDRLQFVDKFDDSNYKVEVKTPADNPKLRIIKETNEYFFIGIDDLRTNYAEPYYKLKISGGKGVNIRFSSVSDELLIQQGL